jgi:prepilin-type N-terminal cleavage/methylation domain-containing protein
MKSRPGLTLIEILIALTIASIIGLSLVRLLTSQIQFADTQVAANSAREVSRSALNAFTTDVRMVDADSGIVLATGDSLTVRAPFAMGIVCGPAASGGGSVIALLPYDSVSFAEGGYAGYAYIDTTTTGTAYDEVYQYVYSGTAFSAIDSATAASAAPCQTATDRVGLFDVGAVVVRPAIPAQARYKPAILFREITYAFGPSVAMPGKRGLFRTVVGSGNGTEELVAPFDTTARFRYHLNDGTTVAAASGATLHAIRGVELNLAGVSDHIVQGSTSIKIAPLTTSIFFKNRPLH